MVCSLLSSLSTISHETQFLTDDPVNLIAGAKLGSTHTVIDQSLRPKSQDSIHVR